MEMHAEHIDDLAEGYALGALEPAEQTRVEEHVAVCPPCKRHVGSLSDTANLLALAATPVTPPVTCKRKLMEKVAREQFLSTPTRSTRPARAASLWATFATIALVMTGTWAMWSQGQVQAQVASLQSENATMATQIAYYSTVEEIVANSDVVRILKGEGTTDEAVGHTYMTPGRQEAVLIARDLPKLPADKTYQVWVAREGLQEPVATFNPSKQACSVTIRPPEPMDRYKWIMVTVENAGGAQQPSTEQVLFGDL